MSIVILKLIFDWQGIKEVTLLGQNVNSYRDTSDTTYNSGVDTNIVHGFKTIYKPKREVDDFLICWKKFLKLIQKWGYGLRLLILKIS